MLPWIVDNSLIPVCACMCIYRGKDESQTEMLQWLFNHFPLQEHIKAKYILLNTKKVTTYHLLV